MVELPEGDDPRRTIGSIDLDTANEVSYPAIARGTAKFDTGLLAIVAAALAIGGVTWIGLTSNKTPPAPPAPVQAAGQTSAPSPVVATPPPVAAAPVVVPPAPATGDSRPPVLIIDNSKPVAAPVAGGRAGDPPTPPNMANNALLNADEQFAARIAGDNGRATRIAAPSQTVPQGAVIPAVLETALNSDLPGFARAVVSRDVRSFDGTNVLIPRGARLIGQYKSGLASGVTRVFIIWTRLIRPDGMSIQLGSPVIDELGQAGLGGEVSTHFLERFGAAMLLSVVSGVSNLGSGSTIVIGTSASAQSAVSDALSANTRIPPTVKVTQGTAIQVFVARDLNFSE